MFNYCAVLTYEILICVNNIFSGALSFNDFCQQEISLFDIYLSTFACRPDTSEIPENPALELKSIGVNDLLVSDFYSHRIRPDVTQMARASHYRRDLSSAVDMLGGCAQLAHLCTLPNILRHQQSHLWQQTPAAVPVTDLAHAPHAHSSYPQVPFMSWMIQGQISIGSMRAANMFSRKRHISVIDSSHLIPGGFSGWKVLRHEHRWVQK